MVMMISDKNQKDAQYLKKDINEKLNSIKDDVNDEDIENLQEIQKILNEKYCDDLKLNKKEKKLTTYRKFIQSLETNVDISPDRLLSLTDGIFGMVMTLLVFNMALPAVQLSSSGDFFIFLESIKHTLGITIVSFILVSSFWVYHHEFIRINTLNMPYLWLNILFLAALSFIPFSTSIIGSYSHFFLADVIFGFNILSALLIFLALYRYAYVRGFLENMPSSKENRYVYNTFLYIMILTIIVNLLDFNVSRDFIYLFLLVPVISTLRDIKYKMR